MRVPVGGYCAHREAWSGAPGARRFQIGAGHHRVAAALEAGVTHADVFVAAEMDDATMIRVYARENTTQRGSTSTAMTGTVAAALRYVADDEKPAHRVTIWWQAEGRTA
jgi:hypothetical protein